MRSFKRAKSVGHAIWLKISCTAIPWVATASTSKPWPAFTRGRRFRAN